MGNWSVLVVSHLTKRENKVNISQINLIHFPGIHTKNPPGTIITHYETIRITKLWLIPHGFGLFHIL